MYPPLMKNGEPFVLRGHSDRGVLLIHGFTGSPTYLRHLAAYLHQWGFHVVVMRLAGHGSTPEILAKTTAEEWKDSAMEAWNILKDLAPHRSIVGVSLGGALALHLAAQGGLAVDRVVSIAAPIYLKWMRGVGRLLPALAPIHPFVYKRRLQVASREELVDLGFYDRIPLSALHALMTFVREEVRPALPAVRVPTMIAHALGDDKVHPKSAKYIYSRVGASQKELLWLPHAAHDPFQDMVDADLYFKILDFLSQSDHLAYVPRAPQPALASAMAAWSS